MKFVVFTLILVAAVTVTAYPQSKQAEGNHSRGVTGRYCASGSFNAISGATTNYDSDHWCGMHLIDHRSCVTVTTPDGWTSMGCDNDDGFPSCKHDSDYCYWAGAKYICCCQSDYCNDCYSGKTNCSYPGSQGK